GSFHIRGDAGPAVYAAPARLHLLAPEDVVPCAVERMLERGREVPAIIHARIPVTVKKPGVVWQFVRLNGVAASQAGRTHAEPAGQQIQHSLHHKDGFGPAGASVGGMRRLVGDDTLNVRVVTVL